jgi:hypothetical protein
MRMKDRLHRLELQAMRRDVAALLATSPYCRFITVDMMLAEMKRACALPLQDWRAYHAKIYEGLSPEEVAEADALREQFRRVLYTSSASQCS